MFDKMRTAMQQLQMMQRLMKDEQFKPLITHPKMQAILKDPEFHALVKAQNAGAITARLAPLAQDPELAPLLKKLNPQTLFQS